MGGAFSGLMGMNSSMSTDEAHTRINPYLDAQTQLAQQLQGVANGTGPNPAQKQLFQNAQQTSQQAASTIASQRGMNAGLAARTAAQGQVNAQQQAAGQAATLQAQQQIAAQNQMAGIYGQQENAQNQATGISAGIAANNQQAAGALFGGMTAGLGSVGSMMGSSGGGGGGASDAAAAGATGGKVKSNQIGNNPPAYMADGGMIMQGNPLLGSSNSPIVSTGGPMSSWGQAAQATINNSSAQKGISSATGAGIKSLTTKSPTLTSRPDGQVDLTQYGATQSQNTDPETAADGPVDLSGGENKANGGYIQNFSNGGLSKILPLVMMAASRGGKVSGKQMLGGGGLAGMLPMLAMMAEGGEVPAMVSGGEGYLPPSKAKLAAKGKIDPIQASEKIKGPEYVKGDSLKNDVVPKTLEEGGLVLPKSVMQAKNPHWAAHAFVQAHLGLGGKRKSK